MEMNSPSEITESPSFSGYSSNTIADVADRVIQELRGENGFEDDDIFGGYENPENIGEDDVIVDNRRQKVEENDSKEGDRDQFEFAVVSRDSDPFEISVGEIVSDGQICPRYPLFDKRLLLDQIEADFSSVVDLESDSKPTPAVRLSLRKLFSEDRDSASSSFSEADTLDGIMPGTYCVWKPKTESTGKHKKSYSTGNSSNRWKVRDLLKRSYSDDSYSTSKDTSFVVYTPPITSKKKQINEQAKKVNKFAKAASFSGTGPASAKTINNIPASKPKAGGNLRRPYLPYRQDQVAIFASFSGSSKNLYRC